MMMPIFIRSLGLAFLFVPLSVVALSDLPPRHRGNGAGLFNLTRELGGSIGTAFMSFQLDRTTRIHLNAISEKINQWDAGTMDQLQAMTATFNGRVADPRAAALQALYGRMNMQALVRAFDDGFMQLVVLFGLGLFLTLLIRRTSPGAAAPAAAH
jgi:DHA2 family multidrug resistance protein